MTQTNRSTKIDLPRPNPHVLYCIRKIENRPELGYCYLTVLAYTFSALPGFFNRIKATRAITNDRATPIANVICGVIQGPTSA